jgi:integrase
VNGATIAEVKAKRAAFETDVARGEWREQSRVTFGDYMADWIETFEGRTAAGIRTETRAEYKRSLERDALPFFGRMRLPEIEPRDVRRFVATVKARGVAPNTVRLAVAPLRAMMATALDDGLIRSNPCVGIRLASTRKDADASDESTRALTPDELERLLEKTPAEWRLLVRVLAESGLRISELVALTWRDVDLGRGRLHVRRRVYRGRVAPPKSRYGRRTIPLSFDPRPGAVDDQEARTARAGR